MIATSGFLTALECTPNSFSVEARSWFKGDLVLRGGEKRKRVRKGQGRGNGMGGREDK